VDQRDRQVRYLISMTIRVVCFGLAIVVDGPLRWVFITGAVFLPYVAVVFANAGRETGGPGPVGPTAPERRALGTGGAQQVPWSAPTGPTVPSAASQAPAGPAEPDGSAGTGHPLPPDQTSTVRH